MKVWLKYTGWYEESSVDSVLTEEAMLKDKQSYLLEAMTELNNSIEHLKDAIEAEKENRQPYIDQFQEYCQRKKHSAESDIKAKIRKCAREIERRSFYIQDLKRKIEGLQNQSEEDILNAYLMRHHIQYDEWYVLE